MFSPTKLLDEHYKFASSVILIFDSTTKPKYMLKRNYIMKAAIYRGTDYEISWTLDDQVTPDLVEKIEEAGRELDIDWEKSNFYEAVLLLNEKWTKEEIEEKLYDEDPDIIELVALTIQSPMDDQIEDLKKMVRLYLPVILIVLKQI